MRARLTEAQPANSELARLPRELVDRWTKPFAQFLRIEALGGGALLLAAGVALALANSPWAEWFSSLWEIRVGLRLGSLELARSLRAWINDAGMTLFFFLVALELKRELVLGDLYCWPPCLRLIVAGYSRIIGRWSWSSRIFSPSRASLSGTSFSRSTASSR